MEQLIRNSMDAGAGVYCIKDSSGIVRYVGSSIEFGDAFTRHKYSLKNGLYGGTSKDILQNLYDTDDLYFDVLHISAYNSLVRYMTEDEKIQLQYTLSVLEEFYINLYKDTICNKQMRVNKSSSKGTSITSIKRRLSNLGEKNPNCKISETVASNIIWLRLNGFKPREIQVMMEKHGINIKKMYISKIGIARWLHVSASMPDWFNETEGIKCGA